MLFYALYTADLMVFVMWPQAGSEGVLKTALYGAFFGLCAYGTYDLSNLAPQ